MLYSMIGAITVNAARANAARQEAARANAARMEAANEMVQMWIYEVTTLAKSEVKAGRTLPVPDRIKDWIDHPTLKDLYERCHKELAELEQTKFKNTSVSYFDFFREKVEVLALYTRNEDILEEYEHNDWKTRYPIYGYNLELTVLRALNEYKLYVQFATSLSELLNFASADFVAYEIIYRHMHKLDVHNFLEKIEEEKMKKMAER